MTTNHGNRQIPASHRAWRPGVLAATLGVAFVFGCAWLVLEASQGDGEISRILETHSDLVQAEVRPAPDTTSTPTRRKHEELDPPREVSRMSACGAEPLTARAEEAVGLRVHGVVLDATTGDGVAASQVALCAGEEESTRVLFGTASEFTETVTTTDEQGRFAFEVDAAAGSDRSFCLRVRHAAYLDQTVGPLSRDRGAHTITVRLEPGVVVCGRVIEPGGRPAAGARVRVWNPAPDSRSSPAETRAGSDGFFKLQGLEPRSLDVRVDHEGWPACYAIWKLDGAHGTRSTLVTVPTGGEVTVRLEGSRSRLCEATFQLSRSATGSPRSARADHRGEAVFSHVPAGTCAVQCRVRLHGATGELVFQPAVVEVRDGGRHEVRMRVPEGRASRLQGTVQVDGQPLRDGTLVAVREPDAGEPGHGFRSTAAIQDDGTYSFPALFSGRYRLRIVQVVSPVECRTFEVCHEVMEGVDGFLPIQVHLGRITGRVVDGRSGRLVPGLPSILQRYTGTAWETCRPDRDSGLTTDPHGCFVAEDLEPATYRVCVPGASDRPTGAHGTSRPVTLAAGEQVEGVEVVAEAGLRSYGPCSTDVD